MIKPEFTKFKIKKNTGGFRTIYMLKNPLEVKNQEDLIIDKSRVIISEYNINNTPLAYTKCVSVEHHIQKHLNNTHFIKLDISNFFDNCPVLDELKEFIHDEYYTDTKAKSGMKQGSRVSGDVTNATLAKHLDSKISDNVTYTRYADDILISANNFSVLEREYSHISNCLAALNLSINSKKTKIVDLSSDKFHLQFLGYNIKKSKKEGCNLYVTISRRKRNHWTYAYRKAYLDRVIGVDCNGNAS